jgi:hypothetical protein
MRLVRLSGARDFVLTLAREGVAKPNKVPEVASPVIAWALGEYLTAKKFKPPIGKIDDLRIKFGYYLFMDTLNKLMQQQGLQVDYTIAKATLKQAHVETITVHLPFDPVIEQSYDPHAPLQPRLNAVSLLASQMEQMLLRMLSSHESLVVMLWFVPCNLHKQGKLQTELADLLGATAAASLAAAGYGTQDQTQWRDWLDSNLPYGAARDVVQREDKKASDELGNRIQLYLDGIVKPVLHALRRRLPIKYRARVVALFHPAEHHENARKAEMIKRVVHITHSMRAILLDADYS